MTQPSFTVVGAGSWGTALAMLLASNGCSTWLWSKEVEHRKLMFQERVNSRYLAGIQFPSQLSVCDDLQSSILNTDYTLIAVPSHAFANILKELSQYWPNGQGLVWATKGLDPKTGEFLSEVVTEHLGHIPRAILTGPSFAKEVAQGQPTAVIIAGDSSEFCRLLQSCFQADYFRVYVSDDLKGAELGGAVKNVLAIAVGVAEGLGYGTNTKAGLMTRGLAEMIRLGQRLGVKMQTLIGLSGLGDLILTASDNQSRNRRFGIAVGRGQDFDQACREIGQVVEGVQTTHSIYHLAEKLGVYMPITQQMYRLLTNQITPKDAVIALTAGSAGTE